MGKSIAELRAEGRAEGVLQGRAEGRAEERIEILNNLGITETEYKKILNQKKTDSTRQPL